MPEHTEQKPTKPEDQLAALLLQARHLANASIDNPRERAIIVRHCEDALARLYVAPLLPPLP